MDQLLYLSLPGWFLLGLASGLGPCMGHSLMILLPYVSLTRNHPRQALIDLLYFSLARITGHALIGMISGAIGSAFYSLVSQPLTLSVARLLLGLLLIALALTVLFRQGSFACRLLHRFDLHKPGRAMFVAGLLTALLPCPALLGLLAYSAASGRPFYGFFSGLVFAGGTILSPLALGVPAIGYLKARYTSSKIVLIMTYLTGFILFGYGVHLSIMAVRSFLQHLPAAAWQIVR